MSNLILMDASAILTYLHDEPGWKVVDELLRSSTPCCVTAANHAEIISKSLDRGVEPAALQVILTNLGYITLDILSVDGEAAGHMRHTTRIVELSLGDRLCLAVAKRLQLPVYTADRPWLTIASTLQIDIRCIRP